MMTEEEVKEVFRRTKRNEWAEFGGAEITGSSLADALRWSKRHAFRVAGANIFGELNLPEVYTIERRGMPSPPTLPSASGI